MRLKHTLPILAVLFMAAASVGLAPAASTATRASLTIGHQTRGCHAWSLNGGRFLASQKVKLARGAAFTITNNDVMPHRLVKLSGPAVRYAKVRESHMGSTMGLKGTFPPQMLAHMGATVRVTFTHPGVYRFKTKPGEDYMPGMKTVGEDYTLRLTVVVS